MPNVRGPELQAPLKPTCLAAGQPPSATSVALSYAMRPRPSVLLQPNECQKQPNACARSRNTLVAWHVTQAIAPSVHDAPCYRNGQHSLLRWYHDICGPLSPDGNMIIESAPAEVASMMDLGTSLIRRMRTPVTARMTKIHPSTNTAPSAVW